MAVGGDAPLIVVLGASVPAIMATQTRGMATASVRMAEHLDEAVAVLQQSAARAASVVVIGAEAARPLVAARRLLAAEPLSQLLFLRSQSQTKQLADELALLPDPTSAWGVDAEVSPEELQDTIGKAVQAVRARRQSSVLPGKLNLMLAGTRQREAEARRPPLWQSFFGAVLSQGPDPIFATRPDGALLLWNEAAVSFFGVSREDLSEPARSSHLPERWKTALQEQLNEAASGGRIEQFEARLPRADGTDVDLSISLAPVHDEHGRVVCVSCVARDVTVQKELEARQQLLVRELNHRVKNVLALVQSLARRTAQNSASVHEFLDAFDGRLQAMSAAHNLLSESWWRGALLGDLASAVLDTHAGEGRISFSLPSTRVSPKLASSLTLILNELGTNAVKYGSLSAATGRVLLSGKEVEQVSLGDTPRLLELSWAEEGGPPSRPPARTGFGSRLITQLITYQHHGRVEMDWRETGLCCRIAVPLVQEEG